MMPSTRKPHLPYRSRRWWLVYGLSVGLFISIFTVYLADWLYPLPLQLEAIEYSHRVVDHEHQPLRFFPTADGYWRFPVAPETVSPYFMDMLIRFEDKRFYRHYGVDVIAMLRAVGQRITSGNVVSGGSTLTMQLARLLEPKPRTIPNKIRQMFRAWQLEWHLDKSEILQAYLTLAPYGGNLQGVEAASYFYFGLSAQDLTPSQAALLVSLPQNPERLRPDRHADRAQQRRDTNLARLREQGVLSAEDYRLALTSPVPTRRLATPLETMHLSSWRGDDQVAANPAVLTINRALQRQVEQLARSIQANLPKPSTLALVVADRRTLQARAYVGSGDFFATQFPGQVDVVQSVRSPGSTLKPFIYGMALSDGWLHHNTLIQDRAVNYAGYQPGNFDRQFSGGVTIREALIRSRNLPVIKVLGRLRPAFFMQKLAEQGISLALPADQQGQDVSDQATLPIAVGGVGIRMADLITLYGCLANQGVCQPLQFRVSADVPGAVGGKPKPRRLISQRAAWVINMILRELPKPIRSGTQRSDDVANRPMAFKTGTSYGYRDAWALGYDQDWVIGVWIGRPDGGFQQKTMGLSDAVPVMLAAFDIANQQQFQALARLTATTAHSEDHHNAEQARIPVSPFAHPEGRRVSIAELAAQTPPSALQYFDQPIRREYDSKPTIIYPINDTRIVVSGSQAPIYRQQIKVDLRAEHFPVSVLLNDERIAQLTAQKALFIRPPRSGAYNLSLIDAEGQSASVAFWVDKVDDE